MERTDLSDLFEELSSLTGLYDIGCHKLVSNKLVPLAKTSKGKIDEVSWIKQHTENPVYVENDQHLQTIINTLRPVYVKDCLGNSTDALDSFSIHSLYTYPLVKDGKVIGMIVMVSVGEKVVVEDCVLEKCEELIGNFAAWRFKQ